MNLWCIFQIQYNLDFEGKRIKGNGREEGIEFRINLEIDVTQSLRIDFLHSVFQQARVRVVQISYFLAHAAYLRDISA